MKKTIALMLAVLAAAFPFKSEACWYHTTYYNDYIFSVNDMHRQIPVKSAAERSITYALTNNIVADFPLTVTMKLVSQEPITFTAIDGSVVTNVVTAKLQYRVLPDGDWVTVAEAQIDTGRLPESYPPAPYLGRNNIHPKGLKKGDQIMVRLYVTDNMQWQSGDPSSKCDVIDPETGKPIYEKSFLRYTVTNKVTPNYDMGGGWLPHYTMTVTYSGKMRPVQ